MQFHFPVILADDDFPVKLVIYVIIGVIWAISAVVKKVAKGMSANQPRPQAAPPVQVAQPGPPVVAQTVAAPFIPRPPPIPKVKKKKPAPAPARVPVVPAAPVAAPQAQPVVATPVATKSLSPLAMTLRRQLQPDSLRRELLMVEILGKPLALREEPTSTGGV